MGRSVLSPENWAVVRDVINGNDPEGVSVRHAAAKIGVPSVTVYAWIARSRKMLPEDEPWIHELHREFDETRKNQAHALEDRAWQIAMVGEKTPIIHQGEVTGTYRKTNHNMLMRLLEARDPTYKKERDGVVSITLEADEIFNRLLAADRFKQAEEHKKVIIEQREVADDADLLEAYEEFEQCSPSAKTQTHPTCLLYTSPSPRDRQKSRMPSSA